MVTYLSIVFGHLLMWLAVAAGAFYAGMVLMRYRMDGPRYRLNFKLRPRKVGGAFGGLAGCESSWTPVSCLQGPL